MSAITPKAVGPVVEVPVNTGNKNPNPTEIKTNAVASNAISSSNPPGNASSIQGKVNQTSVGRTWPQFGQLVASYLTLGLVRAPIVVAPPTAVVEPPVVIAPKPDANSAETDNQKTPPRTYVQRALDFIKSIFTGLYNLLFGVGA